MRAGVVLCGLTLSGAATGCAPILTTFEQPQASGGVIVQRTCPPTPSVLLFKKEGVVAAISMNEPEAGRTALQVSFEVPSGRTVRLLERALEVSIARGEHYRSELFCLWCGAGGKSVDPESLITGRTNRWPLGTTTGYGTTRHTFYLFSTEVATILEGTFTVTLPKVLLNGRLWEMPPVLFTRVRKWIISPFNC